MGLDDDDEPEEVPRPTSSHVSNLYWLLNEYLLTIYKLVICSQDTSFTKPPLY